MYVCSSVWEHQSEVARKRVLLRGSTRLAEVKEDLQALRVCGPSLVWAYPHNVLAFSRTLRKPLLGACGQVESVDLDLSHGQVARCHARE